MDGSHGFPPVLALGELSLRPLRQSDAARWSSLLSDPRVTRHTSWGAVDLETIETLVARLIREYTTRTSSRFGLAEMQGDRLVGTCGFSTLSAAQRSAELVYELAPSHWGLGIMARAVQAVVNWGLSELELQRVQAVVMTTNQPSIAVLERCGFEREGLLRNYRLARGIPRDFFMYSRLPTPAAHPTGSAA